MHAASCCTEGIVYLLYEGKHVSFCTDGVCVALWPPRMGCGAFRGLVS